MSYEEEETFTSPQSAVILSSASGVPEEDTFMSYEEEDTFMSYEEEETFTSPL